MEPGSSIPLGLMRQFADRTGLITDVAPPRRYLWTDAFAVCNFLELFRRTDDGRWRELALRLVTQVHRVLGRHREDDPRGGRLNGLDGEEGARHPTRGGLRIGKKLIERRPDEPFEQRSEWDRDGQYYHYLTKWMHALNAVSRVTGDAVYRLWGIELAKTAHARFVYGPPGRRRMYWKMSIDLSRPLVLSMGQHDPLDGLVTFSELQAATGPSPPEADLAAEIAELSALCRGRNWTTGDPLGIGGLLFDAFRMSRLTAAGFLTESELLEQVLAAAEEGLENFAARKSWRLPPAYRLPFRELGLSTGLRALGEMRKVIELNRSRFDPGLGHRAETLRRHAGLAERIENFWSDENNRQEECWTEHRDINTVMLATSLAPGEFLAI